MIIVFHWLIIPRWTNDKVIVSQYLYLVISVVSLLGTFRQIIENEHSITIIKVMEQKERSEGGGVEEGKVI